MSCVAGFASSSSFNRFLARYGESSSGVSRPPCHTATPMRHDQKHHRYPDAPPCTHLSTHDMPTTHDMPCVRKTWEYVAHPTHNTLIYSEMRWILLKVCTFVRRVQRIEYKVDTSEMRENARVAPGARIASSPGWPCIHCIGSSALPLLHNRNNLLFIFGAKSVFSSGLEG